MMSSFIPFFTGAGGNSGTGMSLHHSEGSTTIEGFPPHFLSLSLAPHIQQQPHSHVSFRKTDAFYPPPVSAVLTNMSSSVTVTPVGLPSQTNVTNTIKGFILPTQPLPPEQVLHNQSMAENQILTIAPVKETKPKKIKSENTSEANFVKCEYCEYCCDKKDRLSRHVRIVHYKEKPFACNLCEYSTGRKDKLKRHQSTVHSQERPFKCDFCPHTSSRKDKLREHVQGVHYKNRPKRPKKKYPKKKKNPPQPPQQQQAQQQQQPPPPQQQPLIQQQQHQQQQQQQHQALIQHHQQHQTHQLIVSQSQTNGVHVLTTASGSLQIPLSLVPVSVSASGIPSHYEIKHHQPHHVNLLS